MRKKYPSRLPTASFRSAPGGRGVSAKEKLLRRRVLRLSAGVLRNRVPKTWFWSRIAARRVPMEPNLHQKQSKWRQKDPTWSQKGAKIDQRRPKWSPKGAKREPNGDQNAYKNRCAKKVTKSVIPGILLGAIFGQLSIKNVITNRCKNRL